MRIEEEHVGVPVPPPFLFLAFLVAALVLNALMPLAWPWTLGTRLLGAVVLAGGVLLAGLALSSLIRADTSPDPRLPTAALVVDGPYRFSRNPIYLGFTAIFVGWTLISGTLWGVLLTPALLLTVTRLIVQAEERYLEARFQGRYREYCSRVRRWL